MYINSKEKFEGEERKRDPLIIKKGEKKVK